MKLDFSHFGIFVHDIGTMVDFYTTIMRFTETDRGDLGATKLVFLSKNPLEHHQLVLASGRPENLPFNIVNQVSFRTGSLSDLRDFYRQIVAHPQCTELIPITHGVSWSVYFRDPEGNRIEVFVDSPFYINQPVREPLDLLGLDDQAIVAMTEDRCRKEVSFCTIDDWRAKIAEKMKA